MNQDDTKPEDDLIATLKRQHNVEERAAIRGHYRAAIEALETAKRVRGNE